MEIKIQCNCGTRYKFDVEPVNGRAPTELACPACGASWTDYTNAMIAQALAAAPAAPSAPTASTVSPVQPSATPARVALRVALPQATPTPAAEAPQAAPEASAPTPPPPRHMPHVPTLNPVLEESRGNFGLGFLGAAAGAIVGSLIYFALFRNDAFFALKLMAIGVGLMAGLGAKLLAKEGCNELGIIAATLSVAAVVGAQYFAVRAWWNEPEDAKPVDTASAYEAELKQANAAVAAVPNGTEQEIRIYLAKELSKEEGEKVSPKDIEPDDVGEFRDVTLPRYRNLVGGKITKEDFEREHKRAEAEEAEQAKKDQAEGERTFKWVFIAVTLSRFNIACLVGAAGLAYKLSS